MEDLCHFFQSGEFIRVRAEELWNARGLGTTLADGRKEGGNPGWRQTGAAVGRRSCWVGGALGSGVLWYFLPFLWVSVNNAMTQM